MTDGRNKITGNGKYRGILVPVSLALLFLFSGCATTAVWKKWSPEEQKRYFGLTFIEQDSVLAEYRALSDQEQRDFWYKNYWTANDPEGLRLARHRELLNEAWNKFGGRMFFRDDRSRILVRHGPPEHEIQNEPYLHVTSSDRLAGGTYIKEKAWAVWEYPSQGRYYDFMQNGDRYQITAVTYSDREYPLAYFIAGPESLFSDAKASEKISFAELSCSSARFRSADSAKVRWEIYWQIPIAEDTGASTERNYRGVFRLSREGKQISVDSFPYRLEHTGPPVTSSEAYGQRNFDLPPGRYKLEIEIRNLEGDSVYAGEVESELVGYRSGIREVSDPEIAVLQDSTFVSADFQKGKFRRVIPSVFSTSYRYQPFYVYYEAYSLQTDRAGEHQVSVSHSIYLSDTAGTLKECIVDTRDIYYQDRGDYLRACHKVHPMAMDPGEYILVVAIQDLISGRTSRLAIPFQIEGWGATIPDFEQKNKAVPTLRPPRNPLRR